MFSKVFPHDVQTYATSAHVNSEMWLVWKHGHDVKTKKKGTTKMGTKINAQKLFIYEISLHSILAWCIIYVHTNKYKIQKVIQACIAI